MVDALVETGESSYTTSRSMITHVMAEDELEEID